MKSNFSVPWKYSDADKREIAQDLCNSCKYYRDGGWCDGAWGYSQYFEMMECIEETDPTEQDCPKHQEYLDIIGEDDEEGIEDDSVQ